MPDAATTEKTDATGTTGATSDAVKAAAADSTAKTADTSAADKGADKSAAGTIVADKAGADKQVAAPADYPEDWRDKMAEGVRPGDAQFRKRLDRFGSPIELGKSYFALDGRLRSGELKSQLPKDAKPEQIAEWRKENGLPEKADGYVAGLALPNGMVLGEADKPLLADLAENVAHKGNWTQQQVNDVTAWYFRTQDAMRLKQEEADDQLWTKTEESLRAEWGGKYGENRAAINNLVARMPDDIADELQGARIPAPTKEDPGRTVKLLGHPSFLKFLAGIERELNPTGVNLPGGGDPVKTLENELATIRQKARDDPEGYDRDKGLQRRQQELIDMLARAKGRAA